MIQSNIYWYKYFNEWIIHYLSFIRSARIFSVVSKLADAALLDDGVGKDDAGAATCNHCPDSTELVQDGQLEKNIQFKIHSRGQYLSTKSEFQNF